MNGTPNEPRGARENCIILQLTGMDIYIYCMVMNNVILFEQIKYNFEIKGCLWTVK